MQRLDARSMTFPGLRRSREHARADTVRASTHRLPPRKQPRVFPHAESGNDIHTVWEVDDSGSGGGERQTMWRADLTEMRAPCLGEEFEQRQRSRHEPTAAAPHTLRTLRDIQAPACHWGKGERIFMCSGLCAGVDRSGGVWTCVSQCEQESMGEETMWQSVRTSHRVSQGSPPQDWPHKDGACTSGVDELIPASTLSLRSDRSRGGTSRTVDNFALVCGHVESECGEGWLVAQTPRVDMDHIRRRPSCIWCSELRPEIKHSVLGD
ncbi:hypothetical protein DFH06DRAFT_1220343 [Mycena polygramma]|nr:hypothetical protein DFH06DRAFT_1231492 [Mycena polygramma]KAJ7635756.1 hypothetical protein DFH06DRAFT_1220343 [Mycena polygramma]